MIYCTTEKGFKQRKVYHTIKKSGSGWNVFKLDPETRTKRSLVFHVEGSYEEAHAQLLQHLEGGQKLLDAILGRTDTDDSDFDE